MTDHMVRGMLAGPALSAQAEPLQIIIDTEYFYNDGASRLKSNTITDRLRVTLTAPEGYRVRNSVDTSLHEGTRCPPGALVALRRRSGGSAA